MNDATRKDILAIFEKYNRTLTSGGAGIDELVAYVIARIEAAVRDLEEKVFHHSNWEAFESQRIEAALVADRLARHDEIVAAIENGMKYLTKTYTISAPGESFNAMAFYELLATDLAWAWTPQALIALKAECAIKDARIKDLLESETEEITRLKAELDKATSDKGGSS